MRMAAIIEKKRDGHGLTAEEIAFFVNGLVSGKIPDYQTSALLMAIYFKGMSDEETAVLTGCMADSGHRADLTSAGKYTADKHSTGGVGDKTTLIVAPAAAVLGCQVAKMSGRGLGHTGGTVDKLESISGFQTALPLSRFIEQVRTIGLSVVGQTDNLAPADKKLYALRDVTATVESIPMIASSIMSKKLAAGAQHIVLDVKTGSGAFMKTEEQARQLAQTMVSIGRHAGLKVMALITNMDRPLGCAVGNWLEVAEALQVLHGNGPEDLTVLCAELAGRMAMLCFGGNHAAWRDKAQRAIKNGAAFEKLRQMVVAQGGDPQVLDDPTHLPKASVIRPICAEKSGYIHAMDSQQIGLASMRLGAGRAVKDDPVDYSAGILLHARTGDAVQKGEQIAQLHTSSDSRADQAAALYHSAVTISAQPPLAQPLILGVVE